MPITKKKPQVAKKDSLGRISSALTAAEKLGLPKDAALFTVISIEIQVLENRVAELEKKVAGQRK